MPNRKARETSTSLRDEGEAGSTRPRRQIKTYAQYDDAKRKYASQIAPEKMDLSFDKGAVAVEARCASEGTYRVSQSLLRIISSDKKETTMIDANQIKEHMEVRAVDGGHIGTVDHMEGSNSIKLTKSDSGDHQHHIIPLEWVDHVDAHVHLNRSMAAVKSEWISAN